MNQRNNYEQFFEIVEQFLAKIFHYPEIMQKHVMFMRNYPDYEWFNIAAILLQKPDSQFVKSKASWEEYCEKEVSIRRGAKSIRVAIPQFMNDIFSFRLIPCFDVSDIMNQTVRYIESPIFNQINLFNGVENISNLYSKKNTSFSECIIGYLEQEIFYLQQSQNIKELIADYVLYSINDLFDVSTDIKPQKVENYIEVYSFIKKFISKIPSFLEKDLSKISNRQKEIDKKNEIIRMASRGIAQRQKEAHKKYYSRITNTSIRAAIEYEIAEDEYDDEGIPIPEEEEIF